MQVFITPAKYPVVLGILQYSKDDNVLPESKYDPYGYRLGSMYTEKGYGIVSGFSQC